MKPRALYDSIRDKDFNVEATKSFNSDYKSENLFQKLLNGSHVEPAENDRII